MLVLIFKYIQICLRKLRLVVKRETLTNNWTFYNNFQNSHALIGS